MPKSKQDRRKTARGLYVVLSESPELPAARLPELLCAIEREAGYKPGQGNKPNTQLLAELVKLFLTFEREGIPLPRRAVRKVHVNDGRLMELLWHHGFFNAVWEDAPYSFHWLQIVPELDRLGPKDRENARQALGLPSERAGNGAPSMREVLDLVNRNTSRYFTDARQIIDRLRAGAYL